MRLPGLHSIHWKVFVFHLAVLFLPVAYLAWQVRLNLESTQLRATEEGMIDTAAVVGELYARLAAQTGGDPAKLRENFAAMFADFENNRSTKARLFGFSKDDADTRLIFYDGTGAVVFDTQQLEVAGRDDSRQLEVRQALQGRYGSRWELDPKANRVNLYSTLPVWSGARVVGAVTIVKPTVRSRLAIIRALRELAVPGLAAVTIATLLAYVLSAYLTRIVGGLATRAERVAAGEADVKLETWTRSELGTLARAVEKMRRKLEGKAYVEEMVTNLSHELKTPLAAIRGSAELLEDGAVNDPAAREKFLGNIQLEASRLNQIVDDLLKLSRIETAPAASPVPALDLRDAVRRLVGKNPAAAGGAARHPIFLDRTGRAGCLPHHARAFRAGARKPDRQRLAVHAGEPRRFGAAGHRMRPRARPCSRCATRARASRRPCSRESSSDSSPRKIRAPGCAARASDWRWCDPSSAPIAGRIAVASEAGKRRHLHRAAAVLRDGSEFTRDSRGLHEDFIVLRCADGMSMPSHARALAGLILFSSPLSAAPSNPPDVRATSITIPYAEVRALWEAAHGKPAAKPAPPISHSLSLARYAFELSPDLASVQCRATFEVTTFGDGWSVVPLLPAEVRIESVAPDPGALAVRDGFYTLVPERTRQAQHQRALCCAPGERARRRARTSPGGAAGARR